MIHTYIHISNKRLLITSICPFPSCSANLRGKLNSQRANRPLLGVRRYLCYVNQWSAECHDGEIRTRKQTLPHRSTYVRVADRCATDRQTSLRISLRGVNRRPRLIRGAALDAQDAAENRLSASRKTLPYSSQRPAHTNGRHTGQ